MNDRLKQLYKNHILIKSKDDTHVGKLPGHTHVLRAYNPMCGDKYNLYLELVDQTIVNASFCGSGCAISKASTAVLTERLIGNDLARAKELTDLFMELINPDSVVAIEQLTKDEELQAFAGARTYPERTQCAGLAWVEFTKFDPMGHFGVDNS